MTIDYFRDLETPRLAQIAPNLVTAAFPIMKLMPARYILDRAERRGELKPGSRIVETTSGTFGMAVALLAAARGYKLTLVSAPSLLDPKYRARLEQLGATVKLVDDVKGDGNQPGRLELLHGVLAKDPGCFWTRQYDDDGNWLAYARLAELLIEAMGQIDVLVGCVGTGGSLCGTGTFLRQLFPELRIVAVDTHRSILFGHPVGKRMLRGLGNSVLPRNVRHELIDEVHWMGAYPAYRHCHALYRRHGVFAGPTCQRRSKNRPRGGAKVGHYGAGLRRPGGRSPSGGLRPARRFFEGTFSRPFGRDFERDDSCRRSPRGC